MPTYEYRCANGHEFEQFQRMSDDPLDTCPECGARAERLLSAGAGLLFKGSGFYITDYRDSDYQKKASSEGGASSTKESGSSKTSEKSSTSGTGGAGSSAGKGGDTKKAGDSTSSGGGSKASAGSSDTS